MIAAKKKMCIRDSDPSVQVGRVQNFRSWSPEMVPDGMSCLGLEYFCFEGDGLWNAPDSELIALAKKEVAHIGLVLSDEVVDACVVRQAKAYPVYDEEYRDNVAAIRLDLEGSYPTVSYTHLSGRHGRGRRRPSRDRGEGLLTLSGGRSNPRDRASPPLTQACHG